MLTLARRAQARSRASARAVANRARLVGWDAERGPATRHGASSPATARPGDAAPVVLCVWQRPERLARTIDLLASQSRSAELHVWNNNRSARAHVDRVVAAAAALPVRVTHSSRNAGGFGRFYLARALADRHPFVVFVDDDQTFGPGFLDTLLAEAAPRTIVGFWAFHLGSRSDYGTRTPARPGERVRYCGTGGLVADARIFREPGLFRCPRAYWFAEDLWLSYYADHVLGWQLRKSRVEIALDDDGRDQFRHLYPTKNRLLRHLVGAGWEISRADAAA